MKRRAKPVRGTRADLAQLRRAGAMCANVCYNLAQRSHLTDDERRSCDESRRAWDEAVRVVVVREEIRRGKA